jgi:hypothetical protein
VNNSAIIAEKLVAAAHQYRENAERLNARFFRAEILGVALGCERPP